MTTTDKSISSKEKMVSTQISNNNNSRNEIATSDGEAKKKMRGRKPIPTDTYIKNLVSRESIEKKRSKTVLKSLRDLSVMCGLSYFVVIIKENGNRSTGCGGRLNHIDRINVLDMIKNDTTESKESEDESKNEEKMTFTLEDACFEYYNKNFSPSRSPYQSKDEGEDNNEEIIKRSSKKNNSKQRKNTLPMTNGESTTSDSCTTSPSRNSDSESNTSSMNKRKYNHQSDSEADNKPLHKKKHKKKVIIDEEDDES
jgi:hypothetical protein